MPPSLWKQLEFGALLAYSPRPEEVPEPLREAAQHSKALVLSLKDGKSIGNPPELTASVLARRLKTHCERLPEMAAFFSARPTLVPVPRSTLPTKGGLWVPEQLAREMVRVGLSDAMMPLLLRSEPIPKAARSLSTERPTAARHFETLEVRLGVERPDELLLVDDVVTAGATLLGAASRLGSALPEARIRAFALARTVSVSDRFRGIIEPVVGSIVLRPNGRTQRNP